LPLNDINGAYYIITKEIAIIEDCHYHREGLKECLNSPIKGYSYWDGLYITIMRDLEIKEIVSFDTDFDKIDEIIGDRVIKKTMKTLQSQKNKKDQKNLQSHKSQYLNTINNII
jgi:hypothetical protein